MGRYLPLDRSGLVTAVAYSDAAGSLSLTDRDRSPPGPPQHRGETGRDSALAEVVSRGGSFVVTPAGEWRMIGNQL
jgi:hypothetical protein